MSRQHLLHTPADDATEIAALTPDLREWFAEQGLLRTAIEGDETGVLHEVTRGPMVSLGSGDGDFALAPHPDLIGYPRPLAGMALDDYNVFIFRWYEAAVAAGDVRCARCGKLILPGDDLPDPDTWDAIFIEKELVAWMLVHFDCKRWLAKKLKGMTPFELTPRQPPTYNLSSLTLAETERPTHDDE